MLNMLFVDPSASTVGVSVLNRVVCTYSSFERVVVFVRFNIREFKEAKRIPCLRYIFSEDSVRGKNHTGGFHLLVFINGQRRSAPSSGTCPELLPSEPSLWSPPLPRALLTGEQEAGTPGPVGPGAARPVTSYQRPVPGGASLDFQVILKTAKVDLKG